MGWDSVWVPLFDSRQADLQGGEQYWPIAATEVYFLKTLCASIVCYRLKLLTFSFTERAHRGSMQKGRFIYIRIMAIENLG